MHCSQHIRHIHVYLYMHNIINCHSTAVYHKTDEGGATSVTKGEEVHKYKDTKTAVDDKYRDTGDGETNYQPLVMSTLQESHIYKDVAKFVADWARSDEVGAARATTDEEAHNYDATDVGATNYQPLAMNTLQESHVYKDVAKRVAVRPQLPSPPRDCKGEEDEGVYEAI